MKKKIKYLTVKEFQNICRKYDRCCECPLRNKPSSFCPVIYPSYFETKEELEQELEREVEINE